MYYYSTRNVKVRETLSEAIHSGLAEDGGLFVPEFFPKMDLQSFPTSLTYSEFAQQLLKPYFENDILAASLSQICQKAFNFPIVLSQLNETDFVLELFHGPTSSFKDFGARFLAECLSVENKKLTIMVATSGDTGSAVASAFYRKKNINVIILYPRGKISARQEHQITCWGENILALAVEGSFDDCQRLVKTAFQDPWWQQHCHVSSANSINIGRLLPQMTYYAYYSLQFYRQQHAAPGYIVPSGNLGHITAAYWAKMMGFPIRDIVLATNANVALPDYLKTGKFEPRPSIATLANAMDVGNPSNFERLEILYPDFAELKQHITAVSATDDDIKRTIKKIYQEYGKIICPHTATAFFAREQFAEQPWIMVSTAHPCKFDESIESIIDREIPVPEQMRLMLNQPAHVKVIDANLAEIQKLLD